MDQYTILKNGAGLNGSDLKINLAAPSGNKEVYTTDKKTAQLILNALNSQVAKDSPFYGRSIYKMVKV